MRDKKGRFLKGNQASRKNISEQAKQIVYRDYCEHISQGYSKECWYWVSDEFSLTFKTMEKWMKEYPSEFPAIHMEISESKSLKKWERHVEDICMGKVKGAQPAALQMIMRNKFGWDKQEKASNNYETDVQKVLLRWEED